MIRLLLLAIFAFLIYAMVSAVLRIFGQAGKVEQGARQRPEKSSEGEEMVKDPECGTYLPRGDALRASICGETHYFCSPACRDAFRDRCR